MLLFGKKHQLCALSDGQAAALNLIIAILKNWCRGRLSLVGGLDWLQIMTH